MKSLHLTGLGVAAATVVVACGGSSPPPSEPVSMATPVPAETTRVETTASRPAPIISASAAPPREPAVAPQSPPPKPVAAGPCDACSGKVTPELQAALLKRANKARSCYVRVLNTNAAARASMTVDIRVGRDGSSCDSVIHTDPPEHPGLADCVVTEYRRGGFPQPGDDSCVQARVPILFTPEVK